MNRPLVSLIIIIAFAAVYFTIRSGVLNGPDSAVQATNTNFDKVLQSSEVVVVDFGADW